MYIPYACANRSTYTPPWDLVPTIRNNPPTSFSTLHRRPRPLGRIAWVRGSNALIGFVVNSAAWAMGMAACPRRGRAAGPWPRGLVPDWRALLTGWRLHYCVGPGAAEGRRPSASGPLWPHITHQHRLPPAWLCRISKARCPNKQSMLCTRNCVNASLGRPPATCTVRPSRRPPGEARRAAAGRVHLGCAPRGPGSRASPSQRRRRVPWPRSRACARRAAAAGCRPHIHHQPCLRAVQRTHRDTRMRVCLALAVCRRGRSHGNDAVLMAMARLVLPLVPECCCRVTWLPQCACFGGVLLAAALQGHCFAAGVAAACKGGAWRAHLALLEYECRPSTPSQLTTLY